MFDYEIIDYYATTSSSLKTLMSRKKFENQVDYYFYAPTTFFFTPKGLCKIADFYKGYKESLSYMRRLIDRYTPLEIMAQKLDMCEGYIIGFIKHTYCPNRNYGIFSFYKPEAFVRSKMKGKVDCVGMAKNDVARAMANIFGNKQHEKE